MFARIDYSQFGFIARKLEFLNHQHVFFHLVLFNDPFDAKSKEDAFKITMTAACGLCRVFIRQKGATGEELCDYGALLCLFVRTERALLHSFLFLNWS